MKASGTVAPLVVPRAGALRCGNDGLDVAKYLALAAMIIDHLAVAGWFDGAGYEPARTIGRVAMPVLTWILVMRIRLHDMEATRRYALQLAIWGALAWPVQDVVGYGPLTGNVLFMLLAVVLSARGVGYLGVHTWLGLAWIGTGAVLAISCDYGVLWWLVAMFALWLRCAGVPGVALAVVAGAAMAAFFAHLSLAPGEVASWGAVPASTIALRVVLVGVSPVLAHWSAVTWLGRLRLRVRREVSYALYPVHLAVLRLL